MINFYRHGNIILQRVSMPNDYKKLKADRIVVKMDRTGRDHNIMAKAAWVVPKDSSTKDLTRFINEGKSDKPYYIWVGMGGTILKWMKDGSTIFVKQGVYHITHKE